jgi:hypothetical protein
MLSLALNYSSSLQQPLTWQEGKIFHCLGTITPTNVNSPGNANPYVAGGDTLDLTQFFNLASSAPGMLLPTVELSAEALIYSAPLTSTPAPATLQLYRFVKGTTLSNGTMQVFPSTTPQVELAAGNYPAAVLADVIQIHAWFVMP